MAVATKGKRKIIVDGRIFWWSVSDDRELLYWKNPAGSVGIIILLLTIVSDDKKFLVKYALCQSETPSAYIPHIVVLGTEFGGLPPSHQGWTRVADDGASAQMLLGDGANDMECFARANGSGWAVERGFVTLAGCIYGEGL
jgi:hypothetical protein